MFFCCPGGGRKHKTQEDLVDAAEGGLCMFPDTLRAPMLKVYGPYPGIDFGT